MFEQVKLEPLQFYHSANCQSQFPTQPNPSILLQHPNQHNATLIESEIKNNVN